MKTLLAAARVALLTLLVCCIAYPLAIHMLGSAFTADSAEGSLLRDDSGRIIGSRWISQPFTRDDYFWPRSSAVGHDASAAGGSNLAPTNPQLAARAVELAARHGASAANPLPADLATASGSGLDPHITEAAARFQIPRIAAARGMRSEVLSALVAEHSRPIFGELAGTRIVNVLELNLALDAQLAR